MPLAPAWLLRVPPVLAHLTDGSDPSELEG
jgi:hypothetical protein